MPWLIAIGRGCPCSPRHPKRPGGIGGFGVGSDLGWDLFGGVGYEVNDHISIVGGYRGLGVDYDDGDFLFDIVEHGPIISGVVRF